jgi:Fic family protein
MLNIRALQLSQDSIVTIAAIDRFQGRWEALEAHTTSLQLLGDVAAHGKDVRAVFEAFRALPVNADMALKLNMALTKGAGALRAQDVPEAFMDGDVRIGTLETPPPDQAGALFAKLMEWLAKNLEDEGIHPLPVIAVFAGVFYQLAPFAADNQRTLRQLLTLLMFRKGYSYAPYALLEAPKGEEAARFYGEIYKLKAGVENGAADWAGWTQYMLEVLAVRQNDLAARLEKDRSGMGGLPELSRKILKLFARHERLGMRDIERLTKGARATLKLRLTELVEEGYLKRHGQARATWYSKI